MCFFARFSFQKNRKQSDLRNRERRKTPSVVFDIWPIDPLNQECIEKLYLCIGDKWARQISVSNEVYELLIEREGNKSFSQVIKENLCPKEEKVDIMKLAEILKDDKKKLVRLNAQIAAEREANYGRHLKDLFGYKRHNRFLLWRRKNCFVNERSICEGAN